MSKLREIWHLSDGKPGHVNQVRGLLAAMRKQVDLNVHLMAVPSRGVALWQWMRGVYPAGSALPDPDLIIGAGQATHLPMLAARRARGGKTVLLMSPQLPAKWFDLCIVPEHDGVNPRGNIIHTRGVLNPIEPSNQQADDRGLLLVGGPSRNYLFDAAALTEQLREIAQADDKVRWTLTTSRRTPADYAASLNALALPNVQVVPVEETGPDWVAQRMSECGRIWVTEDSVSMVYEALASGAAVGVLAMERIRSGRLLRPGTARVLAGLEKLMEDRMITPFAKWRQTRWLEKPAHRIDEAGRCANLVIERLLR